MLTPYIQNFISSKQLIMNKETVILTFDVYWQFKDHPHIKVTRCKKIINIKRGKLIHYGIRGFYIEGKYYKRKDINSVIEKIKRNALALQSDHFL